MGLFFISDLHFGDARIVQYEKLPFKTVVEMTEVLVQNWNSIVTPEDTVYVLGDVSFCDKEETRQIIKRLHGTKYLVMGNHDMHWTSREWQDIGFEEAYKAEGIIVNEWLYLSHKPPSYTLASMPWKVIYGHVHGSEIFNTVTPNTACVCAGRWDYTPVPFEELRRLWQEYADAEDAEKLGGDTSGTSTDSGDIAK